MKLMKFKFKSHDPSNYNCVINYTNIVIDYTNIVIDCQWRVFRKSANSHIFALDLLMAIKGL